MSDNSKCTECGGIVTDDSNFCATCQAHVETVEQPATSGESVSISRELGMFLFDHLTDEKAKVWNKTTSPKSAQYNDWLDVKIKQVKESLEKNDE